MNNLYKSYLTLLFLFILSVINAQNPFITGEKPIKIELIDGSSIIGKIQEYNDSIIVIKSDLYELISIKINDIYMIKNYVGDVYKNNYDSAHYFINSSGFGIKKGEQYYQNIGLISSNFVFGVTDYFSITIGTEILSLFFEQVPITYISPKISLPIKANNKTIGAFSISNTIAVYPDESYGNRSSDYQLANLFHQTFTIGNRKKNISVGFGIIGSRIFADYRSDNHKVYTFNLSGVIPISKKLSFVSDNTFVHVNRNDKNPILSGGIRIHFKKRNGSMDLGLWTVPNGDSLPFLAYFSFTKILKNASRNNVEQSILYDDFLYLKD